MRGKFLLGNTLAISAEIMKKFNFTDDNGASYEGNEAATTIQVRLSPDLMVGTEIRTSTVTSYSPTETPNAWGDERVNQVSFVIGGTL